MWQQPHSPSSQTGGLTRNVDKKSSPWANRDVSESPLKAGRKRVGSLSAAGAGRTTSTSDLVSSANATPMLESSPSFSCFRRPCAEEKNFP
jgi:hypothetical protein